MIITIFLDSDRQELNGEAVELIRTVTEPEPEFGLMNYVERRELADILRKTAEELEK